MLCSRCRKQKAEYYFAAEKGAKPQGFCADCYRAYLAARGQKSASQKSETLHCDFCGCTAEEYKKTGLVGCERCYRVFASLLATDILRFQGSDRHFGRTDADNSKYELAKEIRYLERRIEEEQKTGDYSTAESMREEREELFRALFFQTEE